VTRKLVLLDLALVAVLCVLSWQMRREWVEAHARAQAFLSLKIKRAAVKPFAALPPVAPLTAISYSEVAQMNLFSKDRNPQVVIDVTPPPPPKPVPAFPVARGVLFWQGTPPTIVLSVKPGGPQKGYHEGDWIGEWKIVSLDNQYVVFEWDGKEFKKRIDELMDRADLLAEAAPAPKPAATGNTSAKPQSLSDSAKSDHWVDVGSDDLRGCKPGDDTPAGTVVDGFKKVVRATPFGSSCSWEQVK
jgi:hypothetical protein